MAFVLPEYEHCDRATFHVRVDFSDLPGTFTHYIDRRDGFALPYYIREYMNTNVATRRPDTPARLILEHVPNDYKPPH
jgi:hypothetical protein